MRGGGEKGGRRGGKRKMEARRNKGMEEIWKALIGKRILYVGMNETSEGVLLKNPLLRISRVYRTESSRCREFYVRSRAQCKNSCR